MKKDEIVQYLRDNPGWVLQYQHGIRGNGWWWLRNMKSLTNIIKVDGRSAMAARALLKLDGSRKYGETNYVLR